MSQFRLLIYIDGRCVNDYGVKDWSGILRDVRAFKTFQRRGKVRADATARVQMRDHGPAPWKDSDESL